MQLSWLIAACMFFYFEKTFAGRWFMYRMMRNPGLVTDTAASHDDCIAKCQSITGCSAVSWKQSKGVCLKSLCNNLDLYGTSGWNTYVLLDNPIVENRSNTSPQLEWMLTDTCGNSSQGLRDGPPMILTSVTYSPSTSVFAGNSATFSGSSNSHGVTTNHSACNFPMGNESLSVMFWINWSSVSSSGLLEFLPNLTGAQTGDNRGMIYWLYSGGIFYGSVAVTVTGTTWIASNSFTPVVNTWYHVAYVYDALQRLMRVYLNYNAVGNFSVYYINNKINWSYIAVGRSPVAGNSVSGRLFCVKIFNTTVDRNNVAAYGQSCSTGKIRLS